MRIQSPQYLIFALATIVLAAILSKMGIGTLLASNRSNVFLKRCSLQADVHFCSLYQDSLRFDQDCAQRDDARNAGYYLLIHSEADKAVTILEQALMCNDLDVLGYYRLGEAYFRLNELERALHYWRISGGIGPLVGLAEAAMKQGNLEEASFIFGIAARFATENKHEYAFLDRKYGRFLVTYGKTEADAEKARFLLGRTLEINPQDSWARAGLAEFLAKDGNVAAAERLLEEGIVINSASDGFLELALANLYLGNGNWEQAAEYSQRSIAKNPANTWAYLTLGKSHQYQGAYAEALSAFEKAVQSPDPEIRLRAYVLMGDMYSALSDYQSAVTAYSSVVESLPVTGHNAYVEYATNQLERVERLMQEH